MNKNNQNKTINKKYNDNNKANNTTYQRQIAKIKRQFDNTIDKQQTTNNTTAKNYLQNLLIEYINTNNLTHLQKLANTIVKKTLANYSKYSIDGMYLYNQYQITKKLTQVQQNYNINNDDEYLTALKQIQLK